MATVTDTVFADPGNDTVFGFGGKDVLSGHDDDRLFGGIGIDTASYAGSPGAVEVSLTSSCDP